MQRFRATTPRRGHPAIRSPCPRGCLPPKRATLCAMKGRTKGSWLGVPEHDAQAVGGRPSRGPQRGGVAVVAPSQPLSQLPGAATVGEAPALIRCRPTLPCELLPARLSRIFCWTEIESVLARRAEHPATYPSHVVIWSAYKLSTFSLPRAARTFSGVDCHSSRARAREDRVRCQELPILLGDCETNHRNAAPCLPRATRPLARPASSKKAEE